MLDDVLRMVAELGFSVTVDEGGTPQLHGDKADLAPPVLEALKAYRAEIIERLRPRPKQMTRRVVLLTAAGEVEQVLVELDPGKDRQATVDEAAKHPGRDVAAEWRNGERWMRYLTVRR